MDQGRKNMLVMKKPIRAVAIVLHDDKVLLIWRKNNGNEYYVFPGGGVEEAEKVEQAVLREVREETTLEVKIDKLLYHHEYVGDSDQYFYLCTYLSGEAQLGEANEKAAMQADPNDFYQPVWVAMHNLRSLLVYPLEIRDWLIEDVQNNFAAAPREATLTLEELRQSL